MNQSKPKIFALGQMDRSDLVQQSNRARDSISSLFPLFHELGSKDLNLRLGEKFEEISVFGPQNAIIPFDRGCN